MVIGVTYTWYVILILKLFQFINECHTWIGDLPVVVGKANMLYILTLLYGTNDRSKLKNNDILL